MERRERSHEGDIVEVSEWKAVREHLRVFAGHGEFNETAVAAGCTFPNASVRVTRDGSVEAAMPLHSVAVADATRLVFDHDRGALTVEGGPDGQRLRYSFRRP